MFELLSRFSSGEIIGLVAVVGGLSTGVETIVAVYWYSIRNAELDGRLKIEMLERGMSVEEIEAVINAGKTAAVV